MKFFLSILICGIALAQTPVLPIQGASSSAALIQITITGTGITFEPVIQDTGVSVSRVDGKLHAIAAVAPIPPVKSKMSGWITLGQSTVDSSVWCVLATPITSVPDYTAALIHETHSFQVQSNKWSVDIYSDVLSGPIPGNNGTTLTTLPVWFNNACGGNPGILFSSNSLQVGETRDTVQVRVTWAQ